MCTWKRSDGNDFTTIASILFLPLKEKNKHLTKTTATHSSNSFCPLRFCAFRPCIDIADGNQWLVLASDFNIPLSDKLAFGRNDNELIMANEFQIILIIAILTSINYNRLPRKSKKNIIPWIITREHVGNEIPRMESNDNHL